MGERNQHDSGLLSGHRSRHGSRYGSQEPAIDALDDMFEPVIGEFSDEAYDGLDSLSSEKQRLAEKRRRAEQRLEELRLREELGDYDLEFDDF